MRTHKLRGSIQIAVIGGNGLIGRSLIYRLASFPNLRIFSIDKTDDVFIDTSNSKAIIQQLRLDISTESGIENFLSAHPVDIIVYAAGYENPTDGVSPTIPDDIRCTLGLYKTLSSIRNMQLDTEEDRPYFIYLSSYSVYGQHPNNDPITERGLEVPSNYTGMCKNLGEDLVTRLCKTLNVPFCILRLGEVYGKRHYKELLRPMFWPGYLQYYTDKIVKREENIEVWSPQSKIDLVHINYVTKVISEFIKERVCGIFNIGSGKPIEILNLVMLIQKQYGEIASTFSVSDRLKVDNNLICANVIHALIPYKEDKYNLIDFIDDNIKVRKFEIARHLAIEDVFLEPATIDATAPKAMEAHIARKIRRKDSYTHIQQIAGEEFFKIDVGRMQDRAKELLDMPPTNVSKEVLKLVAESAQNRARLTSNKGVEIVINNIEAPKTLEHIKKEPSLKMPKKSRKKKLEDK